MNLSDISELDPEYIGSWPIPVKIGINAICIAIVFAGAYYLAISDKLAVHKRTQLEEVGLRTEFEAKQKKASHLEKYKEQLAEMERIYGQMLRQLPSKTEMPDLLVDVSQTALSTGIDNELFRPGPEIVKEFYAEKPISLRMIGTYHEFGAFISGVASLPRIVILTMHDISLRPTKDTDNPNDLILEGTAKTYRYVDEDEAAAIDGGDA